jgi:hypothetical protein
MSGIRKRGVTKREMDLAVMVRSSATEAYEALQLWRSRAIRLKSKGDVDAAMKALSEGAQVELEHSYESAGAELAELFVGLLQETNRPLSDEVREVVYAIDARFPSASDKRVEYLKGCVKWTIQSGTRELGDPAIQTKLGECLLVTGDRNAAYHFACGEAPGVYNSKIFGLYPDKAQQEERDRALTLGVVNFIGLEDLRDANELYYKFQATQKSKGFPSTSPLMQFCDFLLQTCRRDATPLFKQLVNAYAPMLDFDEAVPALLMGPIAVRLFGIQPKVNPMMSMLQSMLS